MALSFFRHAVLTLALAYGIEYRDESRLAGFVSADVIVYGATAPGCVAAIAASRSGASSVVMVSPYSHVGGMTTGGLQHADPANESTVAGITSEFFLRVEAEYNKCGYGCRANRCVQLPKGTKGLPEACDKQCPGLGPDEWLAVRKSSTLGNASGPTLTVSTGGASTFFKKSERLANTLLPDEIMEVQDGQVFQLAVPAIDLDSTYYLVQLAPNQTLGVRPGRTPSRPPAASTQASPLRQLVEATTASRWGAKGAPPGWLYEAHVAEAVLEDMLAEANVTVVRNVSGLRPASAAFAADQTTQLQSVETVSGLVLSATAWVDSSYEGDLAFVAGAEMTYGRESQAQYNETDAGRQPVTIKYTGVNPYWPNGSLIPFVSAADPKPVEVGSADLRTETYDFRLCFTDSPKHRIPVWKPDGYDPDNYEFWRRLYKNGSAAPRSLQDTGLRCLGPVPNSYDDCGAHACMKCDMLGMAHSTDYLGGSWGYPNGTLEERNSIRSAHISYILGLLWFWASDPAAGPHVQADLKTMGHCSDEFTGPKNFASDPDNWPYQLYVREARRLVGDFVWTEFDPDERYLERTVGLGSYSFDSHWVSLYASAAPSDAGAYVVAEGRVHKGRNGSPPDGVMQKPYMVPFDVLLPKRAQLTNVLVPVACSSTHVRMNAVRMEPAWMIQSHAAGVAAVMAANASIAVQDVDVSALQDILVAQKQMLRP